MPSEIFHYPKVSIVSGDVRVHLDLSRYGEGFSQAQWWLGCRVLEDCRAIMPLLTGSLRQRSYVDELGARVVFPGPYARMQYGGVVMVDSVTGGGPRKIPVAPGAYILRFRKGTTLVPTSRPLKYSDPQATDHWFDEAKAREGAYWVSGCKRIALGGTVP